VRLKCMKLSGFKSFVDPTTVNFPSDLCGVVGPNGCGKSNIIDAVRWVMGESSAKQLRGESITDVIFNGSGGRKPVGQASIELIFDNAEGRIGGEYAAFAEISVRRRVSREGISNYFLNGSKCRRRDVMDIFLGTGLGPRSYSIIEQGMISNLVTGKPEDLRVYIEEAAGISKYKERRRDTENRIKRTRENLERLTDIREELERVISRLNRQAKAAERYKEYKGEERELSQQLIALKWRDMDVSAEKQRERIRGQDLELEKLVADSLAGDTGIERLRAELAQQNEVFADVQGKYYSEGAEIARLEQQLEHQRSTSKKLLEDLQRTQESGTQMRDHLQQDKNKCAGYEAEIAELHNQGEKATAEAEEAHKSLTRIEAEVADWQGRWDTFSTEASAAQRDAEVRQSSIKNLETSLQQIQERLLNLKELAVSDEKLQGLKSELDELEAQKNQLDASLAEKRQQEVDRAAQVQNQRQTEQDSQDKLNKVRQSLSVDQGRYDSLIELYEAALGRSEMSSDSWLQQNSLTNNQILADQLNVEKGWENAVEMVLEPFISSLSVSGLSQYEKALVSFGGDTVSLIESDISPVNIDASSLAAKVDSPAAQKLLNKIKTATSLDQALSMRTSLSEGESVITSDGLWFGQGWCRVRPSSAKDPGVLSRKSEIGDLSTGLVALNKDETELALEVASARAALSDNERNLKEIREALSENALHANKASTEYSGAKSKYDQILHTRDSQLQDIATTEARMSEDEATLKRTRTDLAAGIETMDELNRYRNVLQQERQAQQEALSQARSKDQQSQQSAQQLQLREQIVKTQLTAVLKAIGRLERQLEQVHEQESSLKQAAKTDDSPVKEMQSQFNQKVDKRLETEKALTKVRALVQNKESELQEFDRSKQSLQQIIQEQREILQQNKLDAQEIITRCKTMAEQLEDITPAELLEKLPEDARQDIWEEQLGALQTRINRLGPINLAAIDEYKEESERKSYLDAQNDELEKALSTLESAIRKIDKETRTRFKETYDKINSGFKTLFPQLFGGGHAYLDLTEDDLLETGISIMARPPGKRNATIQLLSGGEKALTAIALVFAIFQLNPAPFCMLDEVDAPLDDANVERFAALLKTMSQQVQFIFITHNKVTMEMADHLMGVTMHEAGVSRLVSVDVNKAVELVGA
jgi:chromosome segregation protein